MTRLVDGLLVSIHDVTPALFEPARALWALCARQGVTPALLVVPNWHGRWPLDAHDDFLRWLHGAVDGGAEVLLHGERHDEVGLPRTLRDALRAAGRTAREGEFLTLEEGGARERIERGLSLLRTLHLDPIGFVPPAWLAREDTFRVVGTSGLRVSEDAGAVRVHGADGAQRRLAAPAVRWSGRTALRAWGSRVVASARWHSLRRTPLVRLALHPQDLAHPVTAASVERELARWTRARAVVRYATVADRTTVRA